MDVNELQLSKQLMPIDVIESGNTIPGKLEQLRKQNAPNDVIKLCNVTDVNA